MPCTMLRLSSGGDADDVDGLQSHDEDDDEDDSDVTGSVAEVDSDVEREATEVICTHC